MHAHRTPFLVLALSFLCLTVENVLADSPEPFPSDVVTTGTPATWLVFPDGTGPRLDEIGVLVEVWIVDQFGVAVAGFPFQDLWLDDPGGGSVHLCQNGFAADQNTDANGYTCFSGAMAGGGSTQDGLAVFAAGVPLTEVLELDVVSPDADGDLVVNMFDLGAFAVAYVSGDWSFEADFDANGVLDLQDVGIFARSFATGCP